MKMALLVIPLFMVACVTAAPVYQNNGEQVYQAKCNGLARTISDCYAKASEVCNGKFREVGKDGTNTFYGNSPVTHRSVLFVCEN